MPLPTATQFAPFTSQRRHSYVKVNGAVPPHEPLVVDSVWPWVVVPETTGSPVLTGGPAATTADTGEFVVAVPAAFVAVTTTRSVWPTSADWTV